MGDSTKLNVATTLTRNVSPDGTHSSVHPSWLRLIRYCSELRHGEIEKLKIEDGLPMIAEVTTRKIKFN